MKRYKRKLSKVAELLVGVMQDKSTPDSVRKKCAEAILEFAYSK